MKKIKRVAEKLISLALTTTLLLSQNIPGMYTHVAAENIITTGNTNDVRLWYTKPASQGGNGNITNVNDIWERFTLPIGNGDLGGNVYGDILNEHITFNEKTLWTGGPSTSRPNYMGGNLENKGLDGETLQTIQNLFAEGNISEASAMCNQLIGTSDGYGYYAPWGDIYLDYKNIVESGVTGYVRDLNLNTAIATVEFDYNNIQYNREFFVSNPDNVMVMKLDTNTSGTLNFDIRFPSKQGGITVASGNNTLLLNGALNDNQMKYNSILKAVNMGGTITAAGDRLRVANANSVVLYIAAATDYMDNYPVYRTGESTDALHARVNQTIQTVIEKGYESVKDDHIKDYSNIYNRVNLNFGQAVSLKTTDELLNAYKYGNASEDEKRQLEVMLFQYGRYLTIASSRENSALPSNLQGVWNNRNNPPWSSDYHMNVNLQMNYWATYSTNMAECAIPLINYVDSLRVPGRVTAKIYAGIESTTENPENGFMAHTQNTPFGWTTPGWSFDWGWSPAAVPWILQNCWEYYEYTNDTDFMKQYIYPMLKEESIFYDQMLVRDSEGKLVSSPAYSPEHGPRTQGNTYEQSLIWQLYEDTIDAAEIVGESEILIDRWKKNQADLKGPIEIGTDGQIKEWYSETSLGSAGGEGFGHRHLSHMLGLYPGDLISVETPELLQAAIISMNNRTDTSTGWGMGQRINTWARIGDGNRAYKLIGDLFKGSIYENLWDTHPPFQIDGNFGATSGIAEMLLQSNVGYINILPAIPDDWATGSYRGLIARGNFEIDVDWVNKTATNIRIESKNGGTATVNAKNLCYATIRDSKDNFVDFRVINQDRIAFETTKGETYIINQIPQEMKPEVPTGFIATRINSDNIELTWNPVVVGDKKVTYNLYRQINGGDIKTIAQGITDTCYTDTTDAYDILGTFTYQICAVVDTALSNLSASINVEELRNMAGMIDDTDPRILYKGTWGSWREDTNYNGTIKYIQNPVGTETATFTFAGTGIEVITCKNYERGILEIMIDGTVLGAVDTYSPSTQRKQVVFSKNDLPYGKHTIVVRATNTKSSTSGGTKVEFDAFNVLDSTSVIAVNTIAVKSISGMTTLAVTGSSIQLKAEVLPIELTNKEVTWSVTGTEGSATSLATISETGLLTIGTQSGLVKVVATSKADPSINGFLIISLSLPVITTVETIIEDAINNNGSWSKNPLITWNGNWYVWAGEPTKHHGTTKTEVNGVGNSFTFTFTGTEIEVYAQKHSNFAAYNVVLDGGPITYISLDGSSAGTDNQKLIYTSKNLQNTSHTVTFTIAARGNKNQSNLDYIKIITPTLTIVDKTALQAAITEHSSKVEINYTPVTWEIFKTAYLNAVAKMNGVATIEDIMQCIEVLNTAALELQTQEVPAPDVEGATVEICGLESTTLMLKWTKLPEATHYEIYSMNGEAASLLDTTLDSHYRVSALTPNRSYTFKVVAMNAAGKGSALPLVNSTTLTALDKTPPTPVTNITRHGTLQNTELTWTRSNDNVAVTGYEIYVNGIFKGTVISPAYSLTDLSVNTAYAIRISAYDAAGNKSLPAAYNFMNSNTATASKYNVK